LQLATCDFYGDFLLLDPCDAPAVFEFLQGKCSGEENSVARQGSSAPSKSRPCAFTSPNGRSGGIGRKSALGKGQGDLDPTQENPSQSSANKTPDNLNADYRDCSDPHDHGFPGEHIPDPDDLEDHMDPVEEDSDDEDTWRPLNPHEPGNVKIRPYKRGIASCCFWTYLFFQRLVELFLIIFY
jgi:condensin-2 complex subunit H2